MTFFTEIDVTGFLSLCEKIVEIFLLFVIAERTKYSINPPLIATEGAEEIPLAHLFS